MTKIKKNYSESLNQTIHLILWKMIFLHLILAINLLMILLIHLMLKIGCTDSCCNVIISVNVLTKGEENESLLIKLISQIQNPELQKEYLDKFKKNLIKDETGKKLKSTISFEETLERFNKKKSKNLTVNDFQHEITVVKQEIIELKNEFKNIKIDNNNLKQELLLLKIDKNLDKQQSDKSDNEQDEHKDGDKIQSTGSSF